jgi:Na+/H+-dicarboxylate symporter
VVFCIIFPPSIWRDRYVLTVLKWLGQFFISVIKVMVVPVEGIAIILVIDRLLDMTRTAVNITGGCVVAAIVDQPRAG